jgi:hypothetical protein
MYLSLPLQDPTAARAAEAQGEVFRKKKEQKAAAKEARLSKRRKLRELQKMEGGTKALCTMHYTACTIYSYTIYSYTILTLGTKALPPGWTKHMHKEHNRQYFHHREQKLTQWTRPKWEGYEDVDSDGDIDKGEEKDGEKDGEGEEEEEEEKEEADTEETRKKKIELEEEAKKPCDITQCLEWY